MVSLKRCLQEESKAINAVAQKLDDTEVEKALSLLSNCSSNRLKLVVTGVGKSGIIARKIAATFSSIGLMSIFLNPLDALHGDLGIVGPEDLCLFISNSGETKELIDIIPHLKRRGNASIAIVGFSNSTIAKASDVVLEASIDREICPLNLAPTASTAVAMAIGDGLAAVWMDRKKISSEDFALNHPAGQLGKKLTLTVSDLMIPIKNCQALTPKTSIENVIFKITKNGTGSGWVEDPDHPNRLIGIITDGDLRRALKYNHSSKWGSLVAKDIMTLDPITIKEDVLVIDAIKKMELNNRKPISILPVMGKNNEMIGLLRLHDLVKSGLK